MAPVPFESCSPRLLLALFSIWTTIFISEFAFVSSQRGSCFFSSCYLLPYSCLRFGTYGPDKTQQFAAHRCDDLSLVFTLGCQSRVSLMQSVLCLPCNLFSLFGRALLSFAQPGPDGRRTLITPCCFDDDPSQVRVAGLRDAAFVESACHWSSRSAQRRNNPSVPEHPGSERPGLTLQRSSPPKYARYLVMPADP